MKHIEFYKQKNMGFEFYCDKEKITLDEFLKDILDLHIHSIHMTDSTGERVHIFYD